MAKKTVLEYVQGALSIMDSDAVDSIADTEESMQLANLLRDVYDETIMRQEKGWSFLNRFVPLTAAVDTANPTMLTLPDSVRFTKGVWYNTSTESGKVRRHQLCYLCPEDFLRRCGTYGSDRLLVTAAEGMSFYVDQNRMPSVYTSFNDKDIYCDSYDQDIETTLTSARASALVSIIPELILEDDFTPDLPEHMVPFLQSTFNAAATLTFKQTASPADETRSRRQLAGLRRTESRFTREYYYAYQNGRR